MSDCVLCLKPIKLIERSVPFGIDALAGYRAHPDCAAARNAFNDEQEAIKGKGPVRSRRALYTGFYADRLLGTPPERRA